MPFGPDVHLGLSERLARVGACQHDGLLRCQTGSTVAVADRRGRTVCQSIRVAVQSLDGRVPALRPAPLLGVVLLEAQRVLGFEVTDVTDTIKSLVLPLVLGRSSYVR